MVLDLARNVFKYASNSLKFPAGWRYWVLIRIFFEFLLIISTHRASISALLTLKLCLTLNVKDSWRNTAIPPALPVLLTWWMLLYCGSLKRLWFIELSDYGFGSCLKIFYNKEYIDWFKIHFPAWSKVFWQPCSINIWAQYLGPYIDRIWMIGNYVWVWHCIWHCIIYISATRFREVI